MKFAIQASHIYICTHTSPDSPLAAGYGVCFTDSKNLESGNIYTHGSCPLTDPQELLPYILANVFSNAGIFLNNKLTIVCKNAENIASAMQQGAISGYIANILWHAQRYELAFESKELPPEIEAICKTEAHKAFLKEKRKAEKPFVTIYADGSMAKDGTGGYAACIIQDGKQTWLSDSLRNVKSSMEIELRAIVQALSFLKTPSRIILFSDFKGLEHIQFGQIGKNCRINRLIKEYRRLYTRHIVHFVWIPGHVACLCTMPVMSWQKKTD